MIKAWLKTKTWYDTVLWRKTLSAKYIKEPNNYKCTLYIDKVFSIASGFAYKAHIEGYHDMGRRAYKNLFACMYDAWDAIEKDKVEYLEDLQRRKELKKRKGD